MGPFCRWWLTPLEGKLSAEFAQRECAILGLGPGVIVFRRDPGELVRQANGRFSGVTLLSAPPGAAEDIGTTMAQESGIIHVQESIACGLIVVHNIQY